MKAPSIKVEVMNDSDKMKKYDIPLMVDGVADNRKYANLAPGGTDTIEFTLRRNREGAYIVQIGDKQATLEVRKPIPATFKLSKLEINPPEPDINTKVIIKADIANVGEVQGKYVAEWKINGVVSKTDEMIMLPGTSSFFVFTITPSASGIYSVSIGELAGQFAVAAPIIPVQIEVTPVCPPDQKYDSKKKC